MNDTPNPFINKFDGKLYYWDGGKELLDKLIKEVSIEPEMLESIQSQIENIPKQISYT